MTCSDSNREAEGKLGGQKLFPYSTLKGSVLARKDQCAWRCSFPYTTYFCKSDADGGSSPGRQRRNLRRVRVRSSIWTNFQSVWWCVAEGEKKRKRIKILKTQFSPDGKRLKYRGNFCVPRRSIPRLLQLAHDSRLAGNFAFAKAFNRLQELHCKHKSRGVRAYCDGCQTCQQEKDSTGQTLLDPTSVELAASRWGLIAMNFIVDLPETAKGRNKITTIVDRFSRRVHFLPSRRTERKRQPIYFFGIYYLSMGYLTP